MSNSKVIPETEAALRSIFSVQFDEKALEEHLSVITTIVLHALQQESGTEFVMGYLTAALADFRAENNVDLDSIKQHFRAH